MTVKETVMIFLGVFLPVLLGLFTYAYQEWRKRHAALSERRRVLYESLVRSLVELLGARSADDRSRLLTEIETGWLFASDEVLDACYRYLAVYDGVCCSAMKGDVLDRRAVLDRLRSDTALRQELRDRLSEIFAGMRRDLRGDTEINENWAHRHFEIYCWGIISTGERTTGGDDRSLDAPTGRSSESTVAARGARGLRLFPDGGAGVA